MSGDGGAATAVARPAAPASDPRIIVQAWLGTRLLLALVAGSVALAEGKPWQRVVAQWDVAHFTTIATDGYADPQEMAFFPGLPLLLRAGEAVGVPMLVTGVLLALVGSLAAAFALGRLGGTWAAVAWLCAPTGVFTAVPYTEAPFCAAAFWAWERATRGRWSAAAGLAALACTLRVSGLFLVGALAVLAVWQWWRGRAAPRRALPPQQGGSGPAPGAGRPARALAWLLLPTAVLAGYVGYLYTLTGSWTAWFAAQEAGWKRGFHWPWQALANSWRSLWIPNPDHPEWVWVFRAEMVSWWVGVVLVVVLLAKLRVPEAAWVGVQVLAFSLSYWLMSVPRALLLWFPLWLLVGGMVAGRRGRGWSVFWWCALVVALAVQLVWAWLYFTGRWAS